MSSNESKNLSAEQIAQYIDHTLLKADVTKQQVRKLCEEALDNHFFAVCVNSSMVSTCREILRSTKISVASVIGFPLGACDTPTKAFETSRAINLGANEIDMVLHVGALKAQDYSYVERDIQDVVRAAEGKIVKVILETALLTDEEKIKACELSLNAGAHFVKTCTGFGGGGATVDDIRLMKNAVGARAQVKASGGIKNLKQALDLIHAGATRLGTSSGVQIVKGENVQGGY